MSEPTIDGLLQHSRWVNSLAASLARDPGLADDLVQEAWLQVLRRGPKDDRSPRGWLATLLRRQLRQMRRGEERRVAREQSHAREQTQASAAEVVERAELHKSLVQAVLDLREPFRTTVLLRYLEERSPEEIAGLTGVPIATVHSRLGRGLAALRTRLGKKHDERPGLLGLLLWARVGRWARVWRYLVQEAARCAAVAGVLLAGALVLDVFLGESVRERRPDSLAEPAVVSHAPATPLALPAEPLAERHEVEVAAVHPHVLVAVVDREGEPVAGVGVRLVEETPEGAAGRLFFEGTSNREGRVSMPVPPARAVLRAHDPRFESAFAAVVVPWREAEPTLVVAPKIHLAGRVLADDGTPIVGAVVRRWIDPYVPVAHRRPLDFSGPVLDDAATDQDGAFSFASLAALPESALTVFHPCYPERVFAAPLESRTDLELVLPRTPGAPVLRGRVRDDAGRPAVGALVAAHPVRTRTDAEGRFELVLSSPPLERRLVAVLRGEASASVALAPASEASEWPAWIELELSREERALEGFVLDGLGRAVPGARVWLVDPTPVGAEFTAQGSAEAWRAQTGRRGDWWWVESDARGAFRLPGVFARDYRLRAADPRTLALGEASAAPGTLVEIVLDEELAPRPVQGRVRDDRGEPVANVRVALQRKLWRYDAGSEPIERGMELAPTLTDAEGRFALPRCALAETLIDLRADGILPAGRSLVGLDLAQPLEFTVSRRAYLRVELDEPTDRADAIALEDAAGGQRFLALLREWCPHLYPRAPLAEGRSLVFAASLQATTVVFYRGDEEVGRAALALRAGELTVLRW